MKYSNQPQLHPRTVCRRLLAADLPALDLLLRGHLPALARPTFAELHSALVQGELWGWFCGERLLCGGILLPLNAPCRLCVDAAALTGIPELAPQRQSLLWAPVIDRPQAEKLLPELICLCLERTSKHRRGEMLAAVPIKSAADLSAFFLAGFTLIGLRPLLRLCPCWLLLASDKQTDYNKEHQLRLELSDTRLIGRRLEEGWRGVALDAEGRLLLVRSGETNREDPGPQEEQNEAGDSGFVCTYRGRP